MKWFADNYVWSKFCGWALTGAVVVMGVAGVLAMFQPDAVLFGRPVAQWCVLAFAAMAAFSVANANNHAAHAMAAISADDIHWPTVTLASICTVGFAFAAGLSIELGWGLLERLAPPGANLPADWQVLIGVLFISFAKPATTATVVGREAIDRRHRERLAEKEAAAEAARLASQREADRLAAETLRSERAAAQPPQPAAAAPARRVTAEKVVVMAEEKAARDAAAVTLIKTGLRQRNELVRRSGVTKHRAGQLLDAHAPGWNVKAA